MGKKRTRDPSRAGGAGDVFSCGQMAFALRAGQSAGLVFSLSRFARRWRGAGFFFRSDGLRSARARGRAGFFFKLVLAPVARGRFFLLVKRLALRAGQR